MTKSPNADLPQFSSAALVRWLLPAAGLVTLAGYFGPWINHDVAGLVVTGLDMGEYVKFLPMVRNGEVNLWREGFYLPLLATSMGFTLHAFRRELNYGWISMALLTLALVAALNMLPPAWTPSRMTTPEFRLQAIWIVACVAAGAFSPDRALLPRRATGAVTAFLSIAAIWFPVQGFYRVLPDIGVLYNQPQSASWGLYVMIAGLVGLVVVGVVELVDL